MDTHPMRAQEDERFARRDGAPTSRLRARDAEAQERRAIARVLGFEDDALAARLRALGFEALTVQLLPLVPAVEVAWAGGGVTHPEREALQRAARRIGITARSTAEGTLAAWIDRRPDVEWTVQVRDAIGALLRLLPRGDADALWRTVRTACDEVANASGGFLGLGARISREERQLVDDIARQLRSDCLQG